jgi:hypothetical protein
MGILKQSRIWVFLPLLCGLTASCTHYIDKSKTVLEWPIMQGKIRVYPDSNVFVFESSMNFHADTEVWKPRPFYVRLPKGIRRYEMDVLQSFVFYYRKDQVVSIWVNLNDTSKTYDTSYTPSFDEIYWMKTRYVTSDRTNISLMTTKSGRKQFLIKKNDAVILLYNIKKKNLASFINCLKTFRFLDVPVNANKEALNEHESKLYAKASN